jgi:putative hemolysin
MVNTVLIFVFVIILSVASFIFAASESSIIALSRIRLRHMVAKGVKRAQSIQRLSGKMDKFIATTLIGNSFVNIALSALVTGLCIPIFGFHLGTFIATFTTVFFVLVFCEITPKILATKHAEKVSLFVAPIMEVFVKFLDPITRFFIWISNSLLKIFGVEPPKRSPLITEEEIKLMIEVGKDEGVVSDEERKMLHRIFEFGDTRVEDCMVTKENIVAVNINTTSEELLNMFVEEGYARLPVYSGTIENIVGIIYARDLLYLLRTKGLFLLRDLVHNPYYILEGMRVNELLRKFQADKVQLAIVVDKNKKTLGLVTLEDLIEEIVGEIEEDNHRLR